MNNIDKTISLYTNVGWKKWFSKIRFWDAPYIEVEKLIPEKGLIYELGCGEGIFSNFMAISSKKRKIIGIELDKARVNEADRGLTNTSFKQGDATKTNIIKADCVVMFHLLHHLLSHKDQEKVIRNSINGLKKGGKLVIVEVNNKPFIKYLISWITDHLLVAWLFEKRLYEPNIFFRPEDEWVKLLKENGLKCKASLASNGKPFSHIILYCKKLHNL